MDDDGGDWFADTGDDPVPEAEEAPAAAPGEAPPGEGAGDQAASAEGEGEAKPEVPEEEQYIDPDKLLLFKHWIRPKFLQYKYLYNYRHNYYDDVIDYLDKRQKGLNRDIPRAQTWAERALRTYTNKTNLCDTYRRDAEDTKLVSKMQTSGAFYRYHTKEYINRRYSSILHI